LLADRNAALMIPVPDNLNPHAPAIAASSFGADLFW